MQAIPHVLPLQVREELARLGQEFPHTEQLFRSAVVFTSQPSPGTPLQSEYPPLHAKPQVPPPQVGVAFARPGQTDGHEPQWDGSLLRSTSQPLAASPSQSAKPALHEMPQVPPPHVRDELGRVGHTFPHEPQRFTSVCVSVSQPFTGFASQSPKPPLQTNPQALPAQVRLALARAGQLAPHAPQLFTSIWV